MKVTLTSTEDIKCIDWSAVADQIVLQARKKIADTMLKAGSEVKELAPGETRKFVVDLGTIEISREAESPSEELAETNK
jgi:hypothetical protein